jgi:hypothetical protein
LADVDEVGIGVLEVGGDAERVKDVDSDALQVDGERLDVADRLEGVDAIKVGLERLTTCGGDRILVHGGGEVVADELARRAEARRRCPGSCCPGLGRLLGSLLKQRCRIAWLRSVTSWNEPHAPYSGGTGCVSSQPPFT